ncbi:MAG: AAA family ATPase [Lachnospiraceae bacterium]|nr:AAA family ATPase [Lachnospiraceae bacterium]
MRLKELNIKNFGVFHQKTIQLQDGINLIYGENESGKSTLHSYIRSMLFGMKKQRGRAARQDAYSRFEPWENPTFYAGSVSFESGGKLFRLERNFYRGEPRAQLVCVTDGELLSLEDGDLKMLLGGISESVYDNTVSIGQLKSQTDDGLAAELRNYIANYQGSSDGELNLEDAIAILKKKQKEQEAKKREYLEKQSQEEAGLSARISYLEEEQAKKQESLEQNTAELKQEMFYRDVPKKEVSRALRHLGENKKILYGCIILALFLSAVCLMQLFRVDRFIVRVCLVIVILGLATIAWKIWRHSREQHLPVADEHTNHMRQLQWNIEYLKKELEEGTETRSRMLEQQLEFTDLLNRKTVYDEETEALEIAMHEIREIAQSMQGQISGSIRQKTSEVLRQLTDGKYQMVSIDEQMEIGLHTGETYVPLNKVSRGTVEQVYFSLRMAVTEILCQEEPLPLLLDEVFAMYDEKRLTEALKWLSLRGGQILIFTCQRREEESLKRLNIPYHKITL